MIIRDILDNILAAFEHIRFNRKQIFISAIGLLVALSIISSASIFVDSQRKVLIEQLIEDSGPSNQWHLSYNSDLSSSKSDLIFDVVNTSFSDYNLAEKISSIHSSHRIHANLIISENTSLERQYFEWFEINQVMELKSADFSIFEEFAEEEFSEIDYDSKEPYNLLISVYNDERYYNPWEDPRERNYTIRENITLDAEYEVIQPWNGVRISENFSLNNIINMSIREFRSILERNLDIHQDLYYFGWGNTLLVKSFPDFFQKDDYKCGFFHERVVEPSSDEEEPLFFSYYEFNSTNISPCEFSPSVESSIDVRFDLEKFDLFDVSNDLKNFEEHEIYLYTKLIEGNYLDDRYNYDVYIYNNFRWTLEGIQALGTLLFTGIMLFTFPVIIIAIFIAYYSFGLIQRNALQSLSIYLTRGISRLQYFSFLIFEMFFSLFLAIIGAIILSIPITSLSLKTSDFFEFNRILEPVIPLFHLVNILIQIGIIFALITNAIRIIRLSKLSISEVEEVIVEERIAPFWRRKYIDVILLSFGILFLALTLYSADFEIFLPPEFYLIFSLPSPLLIILGSV
ncbi:MAG: hypothetical protein ACW981_17485, partial [Candidatus Hodarchaeales archaeon]